MVDGEAAATSLDAAAAGRTLFDATMCFGLEVLYIQVWANIGVGVGVISSCSCVL